MEPTKPRRRWLKFSLGGLLLAITLLCLLLGWQADRVARQRRAVEMVERLGGSIFYRHQLVSRGYHDPSLPAPGPEWLKTLVGEDWFRTADAVFLIGSPTALSDSDFALLSDLPYLQELYVADSPVTDRQMQYLARLHRLELLCLPKANLSDAGLECLARMRNLHQLSVGDEEQPAAQAKITDAGLAVLAKKPGLDWLELGATMVTERGLEQLVHLSGMSKFQIAFASGTEVRLDWLRQWPEMKTLSIGGAILTAEAWDELRACESLEELTFHDCAISDAGLEKLAERNLKFLALARSPISGESLEGLKALDSLHLREIEVSDRHVRAMESLPKLEDIEISGCTIVNDCLNAMKPLSKLQVLDLSKTPVTDAIVPSLNGQQALAMLGLSGSKLTDVGLAGLKLPALGIVDLTDTQITKAAAEQFRQRTGAEVVTDASEAGP